MKDGSMKLRFFLLAGVVFLLGGITGAALHALYQVQIGARNSANADQMKMHSGKNPVKMSETMRQELNLSEEQTQQVRIMLEESKKEFRRLVKDDCPKITELRTQTNERIRKILTPDQQQEFDKLQAKREAMSKAKEAEEK